MRALELLLIVAGLAVALGSLARLGQRVAAARYIAGACLALAGVSWALFAPRAAPSAAPAEGVSLEPTDGGHLSSQACRSCHPSEYASWHQSYHRSMTQPASTRSVLGPWDDTQLYWRGDEYRLYRRGDEFWVDLPDPDRTARDSVARGATTHGAGVVPRATRRVLMTTGSHHYQAYWIDGARGNELWQLPFVYHVESARFIPRHDAFLQPEDDLVHSARWNSNCVQCHSVAGQPAHDLTSDRFETRAVELGIACEACHGRAREHVRQHQNPFERYRVSRDDQADPTIVNPARLDAERASEVCGQCHSYFVPRDEDAWWQTGFESSYHAGDPLGQSRLVLDYARDRGTSLVSDSLDSAFYTDGTIRVGGREWNGLMKSACFERAEGARKISCLSCHELHSGTRDDQLEPNADPNAACMRCHATETNQREQHSHHRLASSGSECVNCHMPHTTYALFKSIRSHRITSPNLRNSIPGSAPNACNLCHQDRSLAWTAEWLEAWYPRAAADLGRPVADCADATARAPCDGRERWSAAAVGLLAGDAAVRVIFADQLGWTPAREASGDDFRSQLLVEALDDPYAAVRFVAYRSLRKLPGFEDFMYDFIAERSRRLEMQAVGRERALSALSNGAARPATEALPLDGRGRLDPAFLTRLTSLRDDRPIRISE